MNSHSTWVHVFNCFWTYLQFLIQSFLALVSYSTCQRYCPNPPCSFLNVLNRQPHFIFCRFRGTLRRASSKYSMSIPHMPKKSFTYRAIVCELAGLCRYEYDKISCCGALYMFSLKRTVRDLYYLRQLIMQSFSFRSNDWKTKGFLVLLFFGLYWCRKYMFHEPKLIHLLWDYWCFNNVFHSVDKSNYIFF